MYISLLCYSTVKFGTASLNNLQAYTYLYWFLLVWLLWKEGGGEGEVVEEEEDDDDDVDDVVVVVVVE